jgi:hypothetical protein
MGIWAQWQATECEMEKEPLVVGWWGRKARRDVTNESGRHDRGGAELAA